MKILVAPNSFKESLFSHDIARHIRIGLSKASSKFEVWEVPLADGGTGTCRVITRALRGTFVKRRVSGPLDRQVIATYGFVQQQKTAVIELAEAAGLRLVPINTRNPLLTTTKGVGELITHAIKRGSKKIILGVGDSATIDCGVGALSMLGVRFFNKANADIEPNCRGLLDLKGIDISRVDKRIKNVKIIIASDVENILTGKHGALVYARQKGATKKTIPIIDKALKHFKEVILKQYETDLDKIVGSGAAGGIGGAFAVLMNAKIQTGFEIVQHAVSLEEKIRKSDIIITGEGTIDKQSFYGKVTKKVVDIAYKYKKPVIFIAGHITKDAEAFYKYGVIRQYALAVSSLSAKDVLRNTPQLLEVVAFSIGKRISQT